jgi:hypothetical protein
MLRQNCKNDHWKGNLGIKSCLIEKFDMALEKSFEGLQDNVFACSKKRHFLWVMTLQNNKTTNFYQFQEKDFGDFEKNDNRM